MFEGLKKQFDAVVFDIGGVLIDYNPAYLFSDYFGGSLKDSMDFWNKIFTPEWNEEQEKCFYVKEGLESLISRYPQYTKMIKQFDLSWGTMVLGEIEETVEVLKYIKNMKMKTYALTNIIGEKLDYLLQRFEFMSYFNGIIASGCTGLRKPSFEIYDLLLRKYGLAATRIIYIDDNLKNIQSGGKLGFYPILYENSRQLKEKLKKLSVGSNEAM